MLLLIAWGALLGTLFCVRDRLLGCATGSLDDYDRVAIARRARSLCDLGYGALRPDAWSQRRRAVTAGDSQWRIAVRHFRKSKLALAGSSLMVLLYLIALLAPLLAPYDPIAQDDIVATSYLRAVNASTGSARTASAATCLSRILYGARISLSIGFIATAISVTLGTLLGAVAGFFGGKIDALIMRFTDMVLAFPRLVLLIMIVALFSPSIAVIITVLGLTQWPSTDAHRARRCAEPARTRVHPGARTRSASATARIILRHLIPNVLAPVIVTATLGIGNTIVLEAGLSFLGLGVQPPTPSWGNMVADGAREPDRRLVGRDVPGPHHRAHRARVQPGGRWSARRARSAAEVPDARLLEVDESRTYFNTDARHCPLGRRRLVQHREGRSARHRRRERLRQVGHVALAHAADPAAARRDRGGQLDQAARRGAGDARARSGCARSAATTSP